MFSIIPLLLLLLIGYNIVVFITGPDLATQLFSLDMVSGAVWTFTVSDLFLVVGLVLLFIEIVRATGTSQTSIINHGLSMLVFVLCIIQFIIVPEAATSTFFFITMLALVDVVAGFSVTITTARRDFAVGE
ncbi:hypothetical protein [Pyruvatibacter sp.]|uniref:hypothetical protein n=1 Tax=Pyruvatibacter sp. TaxID=1981328 RepID=UPI0032EAB421